MAVADSSGKKIGGSLVGLIVLVVAAWFGIDLMGDDEPRETGASISSDELDTGTVQEGIPTCSASQLPEQADPVIDDILAGGPFDYPENDGVRFGNYEGFLPEQSRDYYREYTVTTPGLNHRGPARIVTGGPDPEIWYFTPDHYESFCEISL